MGNRAVVIFCNKDETEFSPAIYLHWSGGAESIYAFLNEMDRRHIRGGDDLPYQAARFVHVVGDFFDQEEAGGLSLGIWNTPDNLEAIIADPQNDHGDNGIFLIYRSGAERVVRRWGVTNSVMYEFTPAEVVAERREAEKSNYVAQFAETFTKARPKISKHG
jgi:hypothetical protein